MDIFTTVLHPIVAMMRFVLDFYQSILGSWGVAILALSITLSVVLLPLQRIGRKVEQKVETRTRKVNAEIATIDGSLKGEQRFDRIEQIYQAHSYHPIQQLGSASSIIIILPVLISAVILFQQHTSMVNNSFLVIPDLSKPDGLLWGFNLLPFVMFLVTLVDAASRFRNNVTGFCKHLLLSIVLVALVYNLSSALLVFWIGNNLVSLLFFQTRQFQTQNVADASLDLVERINVCAKKLLRNR